MQQLFADGIVDAHAQQSNNARDDAENEHGCRSAADDLHGKAHPLACHQCGNDAEGVGENRGGELGFVIQLAEGHHL